MADLPDATGVAFTSELFIDFFDTDQVLEDCDDIDLASLARKVSPGETPAPEAKWISAASAGEPGHSLVLEIDDSNVYMLLFAGLHDDH